jgi:hypothetical protein
MLQGEFVASGQSFAQPTVWYPDRLQSVPPGRSKLFSKYTYALDEQIPLILSPFGNRR